MIKYVLSRYIELSLLYIIFDICLLNRGGWGILKWVMSGKEKWS